jgi:hypothetical protein
MCYDAAMTDPDKPGPTEPTPKKKAATPPHHHIPKGKPDLAQGRKSKPVQAARQRIQRHQGR